jgi:formate dehydrogenase subunit gamma
MDVAHHTSGNGMAPPFDEARVRAIATELKPLDGPLLPILHALMEAFGYVDERAVPVVADVLNLSRAEVHGVVTFYHDFKRHPVGRHVIKVCCAEACQSMGHEAVIERLEQALGIGMHETTPDGRVTIEPVYCLGNCALSPAALVGERLYGRLNTARIDALIEDVRR